MKRERIDFFIVEGHQLPMHDRLLNWARYVSVRPVRWMGPIWRLGKSNGRQWSEPQTADAVNTLDGLAVEKAVGLLPIPHRDALRWYYVHRDNPSRMRRSLGVRDDGLLKLVRDGRQMLMNRAV